MLPEYLGSIEIHDIQEESLRISPNAIDLVNESGKVSTLHENNCFFYLKERVQDGVVIGPHLIDFMFGKTSKIAGLVRPDALLLNKIGNTLTGMAEFKSGKSNGFTKKLEGFTILLEKLRQQPELLPEMMYYTLGDYIETPENIVIPPDKEIEITFLAPFEKGVLYDASTSPFPVTYFRIPLPNPVAA
jgi:hypothetical protein